VSLVFLLDVDNTLLDNDALKAHYQRELRRIAGEHGARRFWEIYEEVRAASDVIDYPATLAKFLDERPGLSAASLERIIMEPPFKRYVYPGALAVIKRIWDAGEPVILSDGDPVYQPRKIERAGLAAAARATCSFFRTSRIISTRSCRGSPPITTCRSTTRHRSWRRRSVSSTDASRPCTSTRVITLRTHRRVQRPTSRLSGSVTSPIATSLRCLTSRDSSQDHCASASCRDQSPREAAPVSTERSFGISSPPVARLVGSVSAPTLGRRRQRQRRSAEREKSIRAAALRIFRQKGYHAASMQNIADAVGLYKGSLYYYVSSKEELLVRLFEGRADQVLGELRAITYATGTSTEQLRAMVRAYVLGVLTNLDSVRVYLREEHALPPAALRQVHAEQRTMRELFESVIGDGMRDGSFVGTDPKLAALALLGMCTWVHRWYRPRGRLTETAIADDFADRAVRMLGL